jgi:thiamine pyrophosphokinase
MGKTLDFKRVIIFGGNILEINPKITAEIQDTDFIICADAGYKFALDNHLIPNLIVGDFDSAPFPKGVLCEIIKLPTHKNQTDLQFAVEWALDKGYEDFIISGVTGGRLDHTMATISTLSYLSERTKKMLVWDLKSKIYIVNEFLTLKKPNYDCYISVFSLTEKSTGVFIKGAEYPLENSTLTNSFPLGVSNEFKDSVVEIGLNEGKLLVIIAKKK